MEKVIGLLIVLFLGLFNSSSVLAEELKGQLDFDIDVKELKEGDLVKGKLSMWPIENAYLDEFKKYLMQDFMGALKLVEIESLKTSENNADVVELEGMFVVKSLEYSNQMNLSYQGISFVVRSSDFRIEPLKNKKEEFDVIEQSVTIKVNIWIYLTLFIVFAFILVFFHKKIFNKINEYRNREVTKKRNFYHDLFMKSNSREEFEMIYLKKDDWLKLVNEMTPSHDNFFKTLNAYQFKKNWERDELEEVKISFDNIRSSFKK